MGCTDQSKQQAAAVNKSSRVSNNIPWNSTRINRYETFTALSTLSPFGKTTLWEGKVLQRVSTTLSEAVIVIDITGVLSAQTSSFIFTVQTSCKSVCGIICHTQTNKLESLLLNVYLFWENGNGKSTITRMTANVILGYKT